MIRTLTSCMALLLMGTASNAQSYIITRWQRNTTGKKGSYYATAANNSTNPPTATYTWTISADSADVLKVGYTTDSVWVRSNGLTDSMGKFLNPGTCLAQAYTHRFPRKTAVPATKTISPKGGAIGLLLNGVPIYGLSNAKSYKTSTASDANDGAGVWNAEVGKNEGFVLDSNYGAHPQQQGAYHSHDRPYRTYRDSGAARHSPLIGFAFDGYPVYGPYGYATAMDATSAITRMKSGYSLRNITTRTTLPTIPNGGGTASQTGPPVNASYPLGSYIEDYEWKAGNGGDLDQYNGRFCKTPDYPAGTYAYFVTLDAALAPAFPYYIGVYYYGQPVTANAPTTPGSLSNGLSIPASASIYTGGIPLPVRLLDFNGRVAGSVNALAWSIAAGEQPERMELERSRDGHSFETIGVLWPDPAPAGTDQHYTYEDARPADHSFYRLRIRETSGSSTYSGMVVLARTSEKELRVYPTATAHILYIESPSNEPARPDLDIYDAMGSRHPVHADWDNSRCSIDVSGLPAGNYLLRVSSRGTAQNFHFIKQ